MENNKNWIEVLSKYDKEEQKAFSEEQISDELRNIIDNDSDIEFEHLAELMAFGFVENYPDNATRWGSYFGPFAVISNGDGTATENPSIRKVTPKMIEYWQKRSLESQNPMLKARYAGLVWDFSEKIVGKNPSYKIAEHYIQNLIETANEDVSKNPSKTWEKLERALNLAIKLNLKPLIEACKHVILNYEHKIALDDKPGLWGHCYDLLIENKKIELPKLKELEIIQDLENRLDRLAAIDSTKPDPWAAEAAAIRLAKYYRKKNNQEDVRRVLLKVGKSYDAIINQASGLQITAWLQQLYNLYTQFGLNEEATNVLIKLRELGPKSKSEYKKIETEVNIPKEKIDKHREEMLEGDINDALKRITVSYIPNRDHAKEQLFQLEKSNPILFMMTRQIQDAQGRVVASIGSLQDDLESHVLLQIGNHLYLSSVFLRMLLDEATKKFNLNAKLILNFIKDSPIIRKERFPIIEEGLNAYFYGNKLVAIHLLIPQIEEALRNLVEFSGRNVLKPARSGGGFHLKTLDEILRDEVIVNCFGENAQIYFRVLLTDQRGWNLRNNVCHGSLDPNSFNQQAADRVLHALLVLGLVRNDTKD